MNDFLKRLEFQIKENPILAIGVGAGFITAVAKLIDAVGHQAGSRAYARDVKRRSKKG